MNKRRIVLQCLIILVFAIFLGFTNSPKKLPKLEMSIPVISSVWNWMQGSSIKYGLDLQGGTQLDYEIDLSDAKTRNADDNRDNDVNIERLLDGVKDVIEKRVNSLGVSETNIYLSKALDEQHIVVELPGVKDLEEAKNRVGKVVQLEFKTEKGEPTKEEIAAIEKNAESFLKKVLKEKEIADLEAYSEDLLKPNQVEIKKDEKKYLDELPTDFQEVVKTLPLNTLHGKLIKAKEASYIFNLGQVQQPEGFNLLRVTAKNKELRKKPVNAESFETVLKEIGIDPTDDQFYREQDFPSKSLAKEVKALEPDEISDVIESDEGYFIVKLKEVLKEDESENAEPSIRTAHILLKTEKEEVLKEENPLKDIPTTTTPEEKQKLERENLEIVRSNAGAKKENLKILAKNKIIASKNEKIKEKAEKILTEVKANPEKFSELARKYSEDPSYLKGGDLGYAAPTTYVEPYRNAAMALEKGKFSESLVESIFGYHIIKLIDKKEPSEVISKVQLIQAESKEKADELLRRLREEDLYTVERVWFNAVPDPWKETGLDARYFKRADVAYDQLTFRPYVSISFNDEGGKLFEKITEENVKKRIGIFVGGEFISAPVVQEKISGGNAQITLGETNAQLALQEANNLAASLNAGSIPAPLKKPNEITISASLGDEAFQRSLKAGILGILLVALFMLLYYRFLGLIASAALLLYGLILIFVTQSEVPPSLAAFLSLILWIGFVFTLLKTKVDFLGKTIFMILSIAGALFVFTLLSSASVLTLAGVAGLILSIGMAVDANILIFERMKEEFAVGKPFSAVVKDGFDRAWSSILDSNVSTLITCTILYFFGTSIIQGFAYNLAAGVIVSMFTAITVSRAFILLFEGTKIEQVYWLWKRK